MVWSLVPTSPRHRGFALAVRRNARGYESGDYTHTGATDGVLAPCCTGAPGLHLGRAGIGKSALVAQFADAVGIPCISLLGSQLAPEDLIGVPQIVGGKSRFAPPTTIAREEPYCLFLDELNACSHEVQKAFYSHISRSDTSRFVPNVEHGRGLVRSRLRVSSTRCRSERRPGSCPTPPATVCRSPHRATNSTASGASV